MVTRGSLRVTSSVPEELVFGLVDCVRRNGQYVNIALLLKYNYIKSNNGAFYGSVSSERVENLKSFFEICFVHLYRIRGL